MATIQLSQSAEMTSTTDDLLADKDEPPDEQRTPRSITRPALTNSRGPESPRFRKATFLPSQRKQSLLTALIHSSESESNSTDEERHHSFASTRGLSNASISTTSTAELTSDGGFTSPTRTATPSPPLPPIRFQGVAPIFKTPFTKGQHTIRLPEPDHIGPLQPVVIVDEVERKVEAGLGRKRCITFACGANKNLPKPSAQPAVKDTTTTSAPAQPVEEPKPRRPCALTFICPNKVSTAAPDKKKAPIRRAVSPAPSVLIRRVASPRPSSRHRGSDATIRNENRTESPTSVRKSSSPLLRRRRWSVNSDICKREATRFHEFAGSADEVDEWMEEQTCYRNRMTVNDTLNKENELKRLAEEVEEEEEDEDMDSEEDEDDEDDDEEDDILSQAPTHYEESDDGFHSDNEDGFAASDDESDGDSAYRFWAPGPSTAATSTAAMSDAERVRPSRSRSMSDSSINSQPKRLSNIRNARKIKQSRKQLDEEAIDLPDSTDFVCGTLDEDRPKEMAFLANLQLRKAALHIPRPQDIDPSFPESDPEMDEEDEVEEVENAVASEDESDHPFIHGIMDPHEDPERRGRRSGTATKRSPQVSPRRLRSPPPPLKRNGPSHRSPPPRKLFGHSPRRMRSPPPHARLRSPPPTRRSSFQKTQRNAAADAASVFTSGRQLAFATSLPRRPSMMCMGASPSFSPAEDSTKPRDIWVRGALDIVKGLEKKRERRRQKIYEKQCRMAAQGINPRPVKRCQPGKGAERMREVGLEIAAYRGRSVRPLMPVEETATDDLLMLSF